MEIVHQSPTEPGFVQNPYPFYAACRAKGHFVHWADYGMPAAVSHSAVSVLLRDKRLGRVPPAPAPVPPHLASFYAVERNSMLENEPPAHTRLRSLVVRAFTSRAIADMEPVIEGIANELIDGFPEGEFDLLRHYAEPLPVRVIARMLGVPEDMAPKLLEWSHAMVAMYQSRRDRAIEDAAEAATQAFTGFLRDYIAARRSAPRSDLITALIAAEEAGDKLSTDELVSICVLLLNAGHEATVHTIGNAVKTLGGNKRDLSPAGIEELLRYDPPLHIFTRWVNEDIEVFGTTLRKGTQVACLLGAAGRDETVFEDAQMFRPTRVPKPHLAFGLGIHFCVGAPLARLELALALRTLYARVPDIRVTRPPEYANTYHFHGLTRLMVRA